MTEIPILFLGAAAGVLLLPYAWEYLFSYNGLVNRIVFGEEVLKRGFLPNGCPIPGGPDYDDLLASHTQDNCSSCFVIPTQ